MYLQGSNIFSLQDYNYFINLAARFRKEACINSSFLSKRPTVQFIIYTAEWFMDDEIDAHKAKCDIDKIYKCPERSPNA